MIDDLVKRLWESDEASELTNQAARRIEKMKAKLDLSEGALDVASKSWGECQRILEQTEAKLAKAMSALSEHSTARCFGSGEVLGLSLSDSPMGREVLARMDHARTVLAELEGEIDD
jgi:exonuclease VII small subunit